MIVATLYRDGFHIEGHAGEGNDIVCSAVSFLSQTIIHVWSNTSDSHIKDGVTWMKLHYELPLDPEWEITLHILEQGFIDLHNSYPDFVQFYRTSHETPVIDS